MLIMTSERCPDCDSIIYIKPHPKLNNQGEIIISSHKHKQTETPHTIADGMYQDKDGVLWMTRFDDETRLPDYCCIHCGWCSE